MCVALSRHLKGLMLDTASTRDVTAAAMQQQAGVAADSADPDLVEFDRQADSAQACDADGSDARDVPPCYKV